MTPIDKILFLDIETVPCAESMEEMSDEMQTLWKHKFSMLQNRMPERFTANSTPEDGFANGAGIYAEFAKIVCVSVGIIYTKGGENHIRLKSFAGDDEKAILTGFADLVRKFMVTKECSVCGHNIKEFDMPFIMRRMLINGLKIPYVIDVTGKKPWETNFLDTMELWKFGDFKSFTPLKLLTGVFGIPSPKDDIDGSQVADIYYREHDVDRISTYCKKDVLATAQVFLRMNGMPLIGDTCIEDV